MEKCIVQSAENFKEHRFIFFDILQFLEPDFQNIHIPDPNTCVFKPSDVWACPRIYRCIVKTKNVGQTISDPGQKLIVYMFPSIWYMLLFKNNYKQIKMIVKGVSGKSVFFLIELPIELPIGPCYSGVE